MTPALALDLTHDGIRLLKRAGTGWEELGGVALDDPGMAAGLAALRDRAEAEAGPGFETELIIPPSQILYTTVAFGDGRSRIRDEDVRSALEGRTPVPADELVFDWRRDGDAVQVALLEVKTLREAEDFALRNGFNPVRFTARPDAGAFPDTPDFGPTEAARRREAVPGPGFASSREAAATPPPKTPAPAEEQAPRRAVPWTLPEGRKGPGVLALLALLAMAALVWTAYYLVSPEGGETPTAISEPPVETGSALPEAAPDTGAPLTEPAEEAVAEEAPAPEIVAPTPLPDLAETPDAATDPEIATEAPQAPLAPSAAEAGGSLTAAIPADGPAPVAREMAERAGRLFGPEAGALRLSEEEWVSLVARNPIRAEDIWQIPPPPPLETGISGIEEIYLAAIDPEPGLSDPVVLAPPAPRHGAPPVPPELPAPGTAFELDERGLVEATPEGAETPDGIIVTLGPPPIVPPPRPVSLDTVSEADLEAALALSGKRPRPRPGDLVEQNQRANLGGRSLAELSGLRPRPRPESAQIAAEAVAAAVAEANETGDRVSPNAIEVSRAPAPRPDNFAALVETILAARKRDEAAAVSAAVIAPAPSQIPSVANVARQATVEDAIRLGEVNLIGVYGSASDRRALVRLANGRYVKVKVGDRLDGGQVAAIGDNELRYIKSGKSILLEIPSG